MKRIPILAALLLVPLAALSAAETRNSEANVPLEITLDAAKPHPEPFLKVAVDMVFTEPSGTRKIVPAFWAGGNQWKVRYASPLVGTHRYRSECNDTHDVGLHGFTG